ncbi:MAG: hypothetical protein KZQ76_06480 [Candidatus Thiodiazotropha sp. (ex Epidulcina cf. delphinae)]|nr:hypothetical protein [Candidatus Thiodiazotropha sp. (ex Epidulcina cf. delphinae)]
MEKVYLVLVCLAAMVSSAIAGPGFVSRDCSGTATKESITLDWSNVKNYFYTISSHARKTSSSPYYKWEYHYNSANGLYELPGNNPSVNGILYTEKSHAGTLGNYGSYFTQYHKGVYGIHYWLNLDTRRWEDRRAMVSSCNLGSIGYNNW